MFYRQWRHCRQTTEAHPRSDMDAHSSLLNFHAHVGGRGAGPLRGRPHPQTAIAQLGAEQGA